MTLTERVARRFSIVLLGWLGHRTMELVNMRNEQQTDKSICHSHDFCDANQAMIDALEANGIEWSTDQIDLCNAAWDLAKANRFYVKGN